jgi:hypothetical protein
LQNRIIRDSRRYAKAHYKRWKTHTPPAVFISPRETRSELVDRARRIIDRIRTRCHTSLPPFPAWEIREMLAEVATLRAAALARPPAPEGSELSWYVSAREGRRSALLYGPLRTQGEALRALPSVRHFVDERNYRDVAFATFGTATYTGDGPPTGSLNDVLVDALGASALPQTSSRQPIAA